MHDLAVGPQKTHQLVARELAAVVQHEQGEQRLDLLAAEQRRIHPLIPHQHVEAPEQVDGERGHGGRQLRQASRATLFTVCVGMGGDEYALAFQSLQLQPLARVALGEQAHLYAPDGEGRLRVERGNGDRPALAGPLVGDAGQSVAEPERAAARLGHLLAHEGAQTVELDRSGLAGSRRRSLTQHFGGRLLEEAPARAVVVPIEPYPSSLGAARFPQLRMHASRSEPSPIFRRLRADGLTGRFGRIRDARGREQRHDELVGAPPLVRFRALREHQRARHLHGGRRVPVAHRLARGNAGRLSIPQKRAANRLVGAEQSALPRRLAR